MRVVVVEDNISLQKGIAYRLRDEGYGVDLLSDGDSAADYLRQEDCDLVVLDINLPGKSGLDILREMRARGDARGVILLTARSETQDRVAGLDSGADDYLVKPFEMDELIARIRALGRRRVRAPRDSMVLGAITLELSPPRAIGPAGPIDIPRRELSILAALAEANGATLSKEQLLDYAYGVGSETDEKVIEVYISRLRKRLTPHGVRFRVQRGIGYSLVVDAL
ncbi:MAG: response regulator transcription factor [Paracoccaceae bacterium]|nr:response regulator transcription factor [Paracoccaceae bacterium]